MTFADGTVVKQVQADEHVLDDRKVEVKIAVPKEKMGHSGGGAGPGMRKVFVGGLSVDTDDAAFTDYFGAYGAIEESTIMRDSQCSHFPLRPSVLSSWPRFGHFCHTPHTPHFSCARLRSLNASSAQA